jgi:acyl-CoA synthetase (AMP-forming)/AMP-acid ligase II
VVCAAVVLHPGAVAPTLEELHAHVEGRLARFKRPRSLEVVDAVPRTPATNQVQRRLLVERITATMQGTNQGGSDG